MKRARILAVTALLAAASLRSQTPTPPARPVQPAGKAKTAGPPLDFTGVWVLDPKASRGVSDAMEGAVLSVRQNGNRIWIEPIEAKRAKILAEEIIVDGKVYEKSLGHKQKGTLVATWGTDRTSLTLEAVMGTDENPRAATQRMLWRLEDGGKTWTRQTRTLQPGGARDTFLVFRKRLGTRSATPSPTRASQPGSKP